MLRTQITIGSCALALSVFWLSDAQGNLGDTLSQAKAHGKAYEAQYGAVAPLFNTDANGKVNWECWAAPPEQWTKDQAIEFSRRLIPKDMASKSPKKGAIDGINEPYFYPDGTVVILQVMGVVIQGVRGKYLGVEVHNSSYAGVSVGAALFTVIMTSDIWIWGASMREQHGAKLFRPVGQTDNVKDLSRNC
jgi:hypothetical protein